MPTGPDVSASSLPLLAAADSDAPLAWYGGRPIGRREYLAHMTHAAARLPERGHAVNLCTDRYHFMVAFGALLLRGQISLLPPNHAPQLIDEIASDYDAYCLVDQAVDGIDTPAVELDFVDAPPIQAPAPMLPATQAAVVLFTSGSTGKAKPTPKSWGQLVRGTEIALRRFGLDRNPAHLVATVPAQHSYGLESTALYALLSACTVHAGRPFYAEDVRAALTEVGTPRVLVTTPVHLRACTEAGLQWPQTSFVLSATAPLPQALARKTEQTFGCPVYEIYGCSEAGALASRRTLDGQAWRPYDGIRIGQNGEAFVEGPHLPAPQPLADALKILPDGRFELLGRTSDMLNIAGKRGSLQDLNQRLLAIDGVEDGAFLLAGDDATSRLAALVVAPGLDTAYILERLRRVLDPIFLPRPLVMVDVLPRNATGKLTRQIMLELLAQQRGGARQDPTRLMGAASATAPLLWHQGREVTRGDFVRHARELARALPERNHALNLCADRHHFMVALAALLLRGQAGLLPPSHAPQVIDEIAEDYDAYCLTDQSHDIVCRQQHLIELSTADPAGGDGDDLPFVPAAQAAVVLFTSGSSGKAQPSPKTWQRLAAGIRISMRHFGLDTQRHQLVATVPPQHMFGLEFSILYPLLGPCVVHSGRPFYPEDIRSALAEMEEPRVLLTTPLHLRACVEAELQWPETAFIISSTARLEPDLATRAEETFGCPVHEIYGSSETGAVASRRTAHETLWTALRGIAIDTVEEDLLRVAGPQLDAPHVMSDYVCLHQGGRFELRGRKSELVNIAGKRIALGDLNRRLQTIDGVEDGVFLVPGDGQRARLTAVVVAPRLSEAQILQALARALDPVFLPRPLVKVDALPRNATGKLPRQALLDLLGRHRNA